MVPWSKFIHVSCIWTVHTDDIRIYHCRCSIEVSVTSCLVYPTRHQNYVPHENAIRNAWRTWTHQLPWYGSYRHFEMNISSSPSTFATSLMSSCLQNLTGEEALSIHNICIVVCGPPHCTSAPPLCRIFLTHPVAPGPALPLFPIGSSM